VLEVGNNCLLAIMMEGGDITSTRCKSIEFGEEAFALLEIL
jgi:hypothetical protein